MILTEVRFKHRKPKNAARARSATKHSRIVQLITAIYGELFSLRSLHPSTSKGRSFFSWVSMFFILEEFNIIVAESLVSYMFPDLFDEACRRTRKHYHPVLSARVFSQGSTLTCFIAACLAV